MRKGPISATTTTELEEEFQYGDFEDEIIMKCAQDFMKLVARRRDSVERDGGSIKNVKFNIGISITEVTPIK